MEGITLLIAVVALILSILAYQRTGGTVGTETPIRINGLFGRSEKTGGVPGGHDRFVERENRRCPRSSGEDDS